MPPSVHADVNSYLAPSPKCRGILRVTLRRRPAFSLVELVIVVLVTGVLAAVAIPVFVESLMFHRVESAARRIKSDLELVQTTARLTSAAQKLTVLGTIYSAGSTVTSFDRPGTAYSVDLAKEPYFLDVVAANFGGFTEVTFDGFGTPSSGGTIIVQAKNCRCTVTLDSHTGQVTVTSGHTRGRLAQAGAN